MGRLINLITGTKNDRFGFCQKTDVLAGMPTPLLRVLEQTRSLLARLAWRLEAGHMTVQRCHAVSVAGAARALKSSYLSGSRPRYRRQSGLQWIAQSGRF